ncbi:MAG: hypothetical protein HOA17_09095 [Candidatus Melainabacteria bacterium]|mgnify:FL=1|jgi:hypothetical protein|nr:hypothetical protein [Candidatus Melainabacteria bacterium]
MNIGGLKSQTITLVSGAGASDKVKGGEAPDSIKNPDGSKSKSEDDTAVAEENIRKKKDAKGTDKQKTTTDTVVTEAKKLDQLTGKALEDKPVRVEDIFKQLDKPWKDTGAEAPAETIKEQAKSQLARIDNYDAVPASGTNGQSRIDQVLSNPETLQESFNQKNLIGGFKTPDQTNLPQSNVSGVNPGGAYGQGLNPGGGQGRGPGGTPLVVNNQAIAVSNSGPSVSSSRPVVEQTVIEAEPQYVSSGNRLSEDREDNSNI